MPDHNALSIVSELHYSDPDAALGWLARAFGFQTQMIVADERGRTTFAEIALGEVAVVIVPAEPASLKVSPKSLSGSNTALVRIRGDFDIEDHCRHSRVAGATIVQEPTQFFFGDRVYVAADLEGHLWSFAQRVPGGAGPPPKGWTVKFPSKVRGE